MSWMKITFTASEFLAGKGNELRSKVYNAWTSSAFPKGFALVTEKDKAPVETVIFYLNSVAAEYCQEIAKEFDAVPCDLPERDKIKPAIYNEKDDWYT